MRELTGLRIRGLLTDVEFVAERERLQQEEHRLWAMAQGTDPGGASIEPVQDLISFCVQAADWFEQGDGDTRRLILKTVSSNPTLKGKILSIQAAKPFLAPPFSDEFLSLWRLRNDVRTFEAEIRPKIPRRLRKLTAILGEPQSVEVRSALRMICERCIPESLAEAPPMPDQTRQAA